MALCIYPDISSTATCDTTNRFKVRYILTNDVSEDTCTSEMHFNVIIFLKSLEHNL